MKNTLARTVVLLLANTLILLCCGCGENVKWQERVNAMRQAGVEGEVVLTWGNSHAAGVTWNLSGTHGYMKVEIKPKADGP